jgi:hypothetical protein
VALESSPKPFHRAEPGLLGYRCKRQAHYVEQHARPVQPEAFDGFGGRDAGAGNEMAMEAAGGHAGALGQDLRGKYAP